MRRQYLTLLTTYLALGAALLDGASPAAAATPEIVEFTSLDLTDDQLLSGDVAEARQVTLSGKLQFPEGAGPAPLVILLHGSDGPGSAAVWNWAKLLNEVGIATLGIDSYTGRGHKEIFTGQGRVGEFANVYDTYRAIDFLANDPRIDINRVAVMGFSRGGIGALYSSMKRFQESYGPEHGRIIAHLPFYPPCNFELEGEAEVSGAPIRAFHGDADDWNPLAPCLDYIERLSAAGHDAQIAVYPGGRHSFDHPGSPAYNVASDAQTSRACFRREEDGRLMNAATGMPFSWKDACVQMGPSVQYNDAAATQAQMAVKGLLEEAFGP